MNGNLHALHRRVSRRALAELTRCALPIDRAIINKYRDSRAQQIPPVFIVGAPRSGSTMLYQVLTNSFAVDYISNLACLFYHSLSVGMRLHRFVFGDRPFNSFHSERGRTATWAQPSECGNFWYRWFPRDRDFVSADEIANESVAEIRATFQAISATSGRPLVIKNLMCGQRLQALHRIFPEALLMFIRRDPLAIAQSILRSRVAAHGRKDRWWSVMPPEYHQLLGLPYTEQVAKQVYYVERQIEQDLALFRSRQVTVLRYEHLRADLSQELRGIESFFCVNDIALRRRPDSLLPVLQASRQGHKKGNEEEPDLAILRRELANLYASHCDGSNS